jgi:hypothetical protein
MADCEEWLKDPLVNPRTRRKIKAGGSVYKKLQKECEDSETSVQTNSFPSRSEECEEWLKDPLVNPRTRRKIKAGGSVYKQLQNECEDIETSVQTNSSPSRSEECEEWLKDPLVNPRTRRKIKAGGSVYKQLQKECGVPSMTIVNNAQEKCSKIEIASFPTTLIEPEMDVAISSNNDARVKKNQYLDSLKFKPSTSKGNYRRAFGNVFRKVVSNNAPDGRVDVAMPQRGNRSLNFLNSMIKYVPNFVHVFNDLVTEPYIDLDYDNLIVDEIMLFDLVMIQIMLNQFPDKNVQVKNPKLCVLKCDQVTLDQVKINKTKYLRPHSRYRYCLTPDSYIVSRERDDFLKKFLRSVRFASEITDNSELVNYIKYVRDSETYLHYDNPAIQKLLRKLRVSSNDKPTNMFRFPLNIDDGIFYFNVVSTVESNKKAKLFENYIRSHVIGSYDFASTENVQLMMGLEDNAPIPFVLLLHRKFQPKMLAINPEIVKGPYVVKYNAHKQFYFTQDLMLDSVSYIDPLFFEMLRVMKTCIISNSNLSNNVSQINLHNLEHLGVYDINPNFIFDVKADSANKIEFIGHNNGYMYELMNEASNIDLNLFEAFYKKLRRKTSSLLMTKFNTVAFPETFEYLESHLYIRFVACNITSFHPSLFTSRFLSVYFEECNLSANSIRSLVDNIETVPIEIRPRISYSFNELRSNQVLLQMNDVIRRIFSLGEITELPVFTNITCEGPLTSWLNRIYQDSSTTIVKQLIPHIIEMLYEMERNSEFMEESCNIVEGATATCGDRMILSILFVSLQFRMHILANELDKVDEIADFLVRGPFIMSELEKIARAKINTLYVVDEIEVYLGYPIKLRDHFNIPIETKDMLYYACSSISDND